MIVAAMKRFSMLVACAMLSCSWVNADVVLTVDISNPAATIFTPTAAFAENTFLDADLSFNGITLVGIVTGNTSSLNESLDAGSLDVFDSSAGTTRSPLSVFFTGISAGGFTKNDITFYDDVGFTMSFLDTAQPMTGVATHDLSFSTVLPTIGATGDIVAGAPEDNRVIGQWRVAAAIPEPSAFALMGLVACGGMAYRWKKIMWLVTKKLSIL